MLFSALRKKGFIPAAYYKNVSEIDWGRIYALGYRLILLDVDNTLIPHGQSGKTDFSVSVLAAIQAEGLKVSILSNAKASRAGAVGRALGVPAQGMANKPGPKGIIRASAAFGIPMERIILVGDQYFTDMLAGRNAGCQTILVEPLNIKEPWYIRLKRWQERRMYRRIGRDDYYDNLPDAAENEAE